MKDLRQTGYKPFYILFQVDGVEFLTEVYVTLNAIHSIFIFASMRRSCPDAGIFCLFRLKEVFET